MNRTIKSAENYSEKTVSHTKYLSKFNQKKSSMLNTTTGYQKVTKNCKTSSNSSNNIKNIQINLVGKTHGIEAEIVGEEGTAQIIRSPIVKRGKSMNNSMDLIQNSKTLNDKLIKNQNDPLNKLILENISLKKQLEFHKEQLKVYQKTISDLSGKFEISKQEIADLEDKITQVLIENRKLTEENEKVMSMIKFLENDHCSLSNKNYLQEALEAKLLSIDQDREEKAEKYNQILTKYISNLQEYLNSQE